MEITTATAISYLHCWGELKNGNLCREIGTQTSVAQICMPGYAALNA